MSKWLSLHFEKLLLLVAVVGLIGSLALSRTFLAQSRARLEAAEWAAPKGDVEMAALVDLAPFDCAWEPRSMRPSDRPFFVSERRVWAVGSFLPIPYAATVCPFSGVVQPDSGLDSDSDGFTDSEECLAGTDPQNSDSCPSYAAKLRVERVTHTPFNLLYEGYSKFSGDQKTFQLNCCSGGKTYFCCLGQEVIDTDGFGAKSGTGIVLESYDEARDVLVLTQGDKKIPLKRGAAIEAYELKVSLLNLADNSRLVKRVAEPIELKDGVYVVKSISDDAVFVESSSGRVMEIILK